MFVKPCKGSKVGLEITSLRSGEIDGLKISLPAKIVAESDYAYLVEHPQGGELEDYDYFRFNFRSSRDKRYWAVGKDEVLEFSGPKDEKIDKVKEILEKHTNHVGEELSSEVIKKEFDDRIEYHLNGNLHRTDGPAIEWSDGGKHWYLEGKRHRTDGPAVENANGGKEWYVDGKCHRTDGPAIECANGDKHWYLEGKRHRTDGPAIEYAYGDKIWYVEGKRHRTDGPAVEHTDGDKSWYVEGEEYTEEEFKKKMSSEVIKKEFDNRVEYHLNGKLHRTDGPACEYANGTKYWYIDGKRHRTDGPAIEWSDGGKEWYVKGKLHRTDGPAIECANGGKYWHIEGKEYTEEEFKKKISSHLIKKVNMKNENLKDQVKSDLEQVAYRQGARKITSVSHAVILHVFRQQGFSESKLNVLLDILESAPGKALLSYGLGKGLERVMTDSEIAQNLAEEFRVSGMDLGVEAGLDKLAAKGLELAPAAIGLISAIEKTTQEGLTLESLQEFSSVNSKLPKEYQDELDALEKRVRISDPTPEEVLTSEFENQAETEAQAETEIEPQAVTYASCS
jgi:hypothetical protein